MKPNFKFAKNSLVLLICWGLITPSYAAIGLLNVPPQATVPPIPNVILTLDDSGSMQATVPYVSTINYVIPPNADGQPRKDGGGAPRAYSDGYDEPQAVLGNVNLSGSNAYNAVPAAEKQNYANWYSYYRDRSLQMKASAALAFSPQVIPDGRIRLAWQQLNANCNSFTNNSGCTNNRMAALEGSHRSNLYSWLWTVDPNGSTPLKAATIRAGEYLKTTGIKNPYGQIPGTTELPLLTCRRSYHVVITDGGWNESYTGSNEDNTVQTLPDGVNYTKNTPYRGPNNSNGQNTLADISFRYWATDLQPSISNGLTPKIKVPGAETYGTTSIAEYWNPKNNPATWQHMTLFAVGLGEAADLTPAAVGWTSAIAPTFTTATTAGPTFAEIVAGTREWPPAESAAIDQRSFDLWHAAVNSRGEMFAAKTPDKLIAAFKQIVAEILQGSAPSGGASSSLAYTPDFVTVSSGYIGTPTWRGVVKAFGQTDSVIDSAALFDAGTIITKQTPNAKVILTASGPTAGSAFRWANLSAFQQNMLNRSSSAGAIDNLGVDRLAYLRGERTKEVTATITPVPAFRSRGEDTSAFDSSVKGNVLGTIVNSEPRLMGKPRSGFFDPTYKAFRDANVGRTKIMYVGANDGMYHGTNADPTSNKQGQALISYVPRGVFARLSEYADVTYQHKYYVDGANIVGDAYVDGAWKTFAFSSLGAGGRGIFGLDVTNPSNFTESNAAQLLKFDYTAPSEALPTTAPNAATQFLSESGSGFMAELASDLGHIMGDSVRDSNIGRAIQISQLQNNRWALIIGNGVNSVNERPALYIIYLDAAGGFQKIIPAGAAVGDNGLSTPRPVDTDGDGKIDTIYAGDLKGKLWKFKSNSTGTFSLSNGNLPLLDVGKPITSAPAIGLHPKGGIFVSIGTGRFYTYADKTSTDGQTIYGVWDKPGVVGTVALGDLVSRSLSTGGVTSLNGSVDVRTITGATIDYRTQRGWFMNLSISGERVIYNPFSDSGIVFYSTFVPVEGQACGGAGQTGSLLAFSLINGSATPSPSFDVNGDGKFDKSDRASTSQTVNNVGGITLGVGKLSAIISSPTGGGIGGSRGKCDAIGGSASVGVACNTGPGRVLWRDLTP